MRVLIVDDEALIARSLARLLRAAGHDVRVFTAPSLIGEGDYAWANVVLTDWDMPDGGAAAVIACCGAKVPWLVMSGNDLVVERIRAIGGMALNKPARMPDITAALTWLLAARPELTAGACR